MTREAREVYPAAELDVAVPPGETLQEALEEQGMTVPDLAGHTSLSTTRIDGLIAGDVELTQHDAMWLANATGIPERLWMALEANYRAALAAGKKMCQ